METQEGDAHSSESDASKEKGRGGFVALPFIIANEMLERVAGFGLNTNMIMYLTKQYHLTNVTAGATLFAWAAAANFAPIPGALIADMYIGRFVAISMGSIACLTGIVFLWLSAMIPGAQPPPCAVGLAPAQCTPPGPRHLSWLIAGFTFLSIGAGGIRPCSMAFGVDQFSRHPKEQRSRILQAYFNAYYASIGVAFTVAVTVIVYVQDNVGWKAGFAVPMGLMTLSAVSFLLGSRLYIKEKGSKQMFSGIGGAILAAVKNYRVRLPAKTEDGVYHHLKDCKLTVPTDKLRFLNKACMISSNGNEDPHGNEVSATDCHNNGDRRLCTVDQVEQLKSVIRILPIWSSTVFLAQAIGQNYAVLQANEMDRRVGAFRVPGCSLTMFNMVTMSLWSGSYDRWIAPALRRVTGNPRGLTMKQRIGVGLLLATAAMAVSAAVEGARRRLALAGTGTAAAPMSAFWLVPQFALMGLAEAFGVIGELEFFYTELPKSMASFSMALLYMALGVGNLVNSLIVKVVDQASRSGGRTSWLSSDLNAGHYDYYYWLLACLGAVNFVYFLWCAWAYGEEEKNVQWEEDGEAERPVA